MTSDTSRPVIKLAVIGHTNAGKTSLLRTLTRDRNFGEVSVHPATTRNVEAVRLDMTPGLSVEFHDTPGFEDSIGLLNALHRLEPDPRTAGPARLAKFLQSPEVNAEFVQEAKALRQLLQCDLALYVADASEPVSGKYGDEFVILTWSGKPCLVVLNFVAGAAHTDVWLEAMRNAGLHNVVEFDTVVFNARDEHRLFQQIAVLLPSAEPHLRQLQALRTEERSQQLDAAALLITEALFESAAAHAAGPDAIKLVQDKVRMLEQRLNCDLLTLFRFAESDYTPADLPIQGTRWTTDLFDPDIMAALGLSLGGSAAKGAAAGVAIDLATGLTTLGMATLIGGVIGAGLDGGRKIKKYITMRPEQDSSVQAAIESLRLLARRACLLVRDLAGRGHAAVQPVRAHTDLASGLREEPRIVRILEQSRSRPEWASAQADAKQPRLVHELQSLIRINLPGAEGDYFTTGNND